MTKAALELPHCEACHRPHWPPRKICPHCLGDTIVWRQAQGSGNVLTSCVLHHSLSAELRPHLHLYVATIKLDCGARVVAYLADEAQTVGTRVDVIMGSGPSGGKALVAKPIAPR